MYPSGPSVTSALLRFSGGLSEVGEAGTAQGHLLCPCLGDLERIFSLTCLLKVADGV